jgi:hypothetical protein
MNVSDVSAEIRRASVGGNEMKQSDGAVESPVRGRKRSRRGYRCWLAGLLAVVACGVAALMPGVAFAQWGWPHAFGSEQLKGNWPIGVAVNEVGDIYVSTVLSGNDKYNSMGELIVPPSPFGGGLFNTGNAVDPVNGSLFAINAVSQELDTFNPDSGALEGTPFSIAGTGNVSKGEYTAVQIAADAQGNVYVPDAPGNKIEVFSATGGGPSGGLAGDIAGSGEHALSKPEGVAVEPDGNVWVADTGDNRIEEFEPSGTFIKEIASPDPRTIAVDGGDVFVTGPLVVNGGERVQVFEYALSGARMADFGSLGHAKFEAGSAIAIDPTRNLVYVVGESAEGGEAVFRFATWGVITGLGARVDEAGATLSGTVEIEPGSAPVTSCQFEYGTTTAYGQSVPCGSEPAGGYTRTTQVAATLEGLPRAFYHYRVVASNEDGVTQVGEDETFGLESFSLEALDLNKATLAFEPDAQAGGHPYELKTELVFPSTTGMDPKRNPTVVANPKDIDVELPPGLVGNPEATPKCSPYDVAHADCSGATQVGTLEVFTAGNEAHTSPIYNLLPPKGVAAQFGARFNGLVTAHIDASVRTGGDYGVNADSLEVSASEGLTGAVVAFWGVPAEASHNEDRYCPFEPGSVNEYSPCSERGSLKPFLANPTACAGPQTATVHVDTWHEPGVFDSVSTEMPAITSCGKVPFSPSITVTPESHSSDSPAGLEVRLKVPQNENPTGTAEADLKNAKVVLPVGVTLNPSSASGLVGCPLLTGKSPEQEAKEANGEVSGINLETVYGANCPNASKVGKVTIKTPLLEEELEGGVYVAQQNANPFKSLLALYIAVEDPERGVVVKLAGHVELNEKTGQLTTTFDENPQLPFETLKLDFFGGERAPLATPRTCGSYQPTALLEPWSHQPAEGEAEGTPNAEPFIHPFEVTSGPGGSACSGSGFTPSFEAGAINNQAGAHGGFALNLTRKDGEQRFSTVSMTMPPGLAGMISKVTPCANAQADAGDCPAASKIGHVTVEAGVGGEPITVPEAGKPEDPVYLTEKYGGAPFGLSIVVPAEAGPFNLGTVIVRAKIDVNPATAQVSIESEPMPTILQGIPLDVKAIHVEVNKPEFMFNPTNCDELHVDGTIGSAEGASAPVSSRFEAANCASLPFKPSLTAQTHAHHTRKGGSYLKVKITAKAGEANLAKVRVTLPKKLPADLNTLNMSCTEAQFAANPSDCPKASFVGTAVVHTPVLTEPLRGPAIFVSHGHAKFPDLALVLQGEGVTIIQEGSTVIKKGLTTSSFDAVPDVPVSSIELTLPEGEDPALGGNSGNLCTKTAVKRVRKKVKGKVVEHKRKVTEKLTLQMPTTITGQNGAILTQTTKVKVTGCAAAAKGHKKGKSATGKGKHSRSAGRGKHKH